MFPKKITLLAPHPIAQCLERLKPCIDTSLMKFGKQPFVGKLTGTKLSIRKRLGYRNSFQPALTAGMVSGPDGTQTRIEGHLGLPRAAVYFMILWTAGVLSGVVFLSIPAAIRYFSGVEPAQGGSLIAGILIPPGMLLFAFLLTTFCRWLARGEEAEILAFMERTLEAAPISPLISEERGA